MRPHVVLFSLSQEGQDQELKRAPARAQHKHRQGLNSQVRCVALDARALSLSPLSFFRITQYNEDAHNTHAHSHSMNTRTQTYPYEHLRRTEHRQI